MSAPLGAQCALGAWEPSFDHTGTAVSCGPLGSPFPVGNFTALHMSLIPHGEFQGWVMVFDHDHFDGPPANQNRPLRWALVDPVTKACKNFCWVDPAGTGQGDIFCAGHAWTATGTLLVVGGTGCHEGTPGCSDWGGARIAYTWTPPPLGQTSSGGTWNRVGNGQLVNKRWYPSVVALNESGAYQDVSAMMVLGGSDNGTDQNSYEIFEPGPTPAWTAYNGPSPTTNPDAVLGDYPRAHLISSNALGGLATVVTAGMKVESSRADHYVAAGSWLSASAWDQKFWRDYGSSVLMPIGVNGVPTDYILSTGGCDGGPGFPIRDSAQLCQAGAAPSALTWTDVASLLHRRWFHNTVLLPDGRVLVTGGEKQSKHFGCAEVPAYCPEIYDVTTNTWALMKEDSIIRDYHSTALLLPSGKVLTGGGEYRNFLPELDCDSGKLMTPAPNQLADYRIWRPYYIECGNTRPTITNAPSRGNVWSWTYGGSYTIEILPLPYPGPSVDKVVAMRAGSVTHHTDGNQRLVELDLQQIGGTELQVHVPAKSLGILPAGHYMVFVLTDQGVPSVAAWAQIR